LSLQLSAEFCGLHCGVLMDKAPPAAKSDDKLVDVAGRLLGMDFKAVIVYEDSEPVGLITLKDIMKWLLVAEDKSKLVIGDLVSVPLVAVDVDTTLEDAMSVMRKYRINCLGVHENKAIRGLVTQQGIKEFCELYPHYLRRYAV
jgi:CBS domain-containing protein